jgi:signal transduction histidine kinase
LYVVHEVVQAHGGTVTVTSAPTTGTAFTILLPLAPSA